MFRNITRLICIITALLFGIITFAQANCESTKPIIGIMLNEGTEGGYSIYPWYALRKNYSQVIADMGGIPVLLSHDVKNISDYFAFLDGILLTGGEVATPEEAFTTGVQGPVDPSRFPRSYIEFQLAKMAYENDLPLLGICAGMQNMNVALGGILYRNLKESLGTTIEHKNDIRDKPHHAITIFPQTQLSAILKADKLEVNSNHRAGIKTVASMLRVNAKAPDGVIEGFEAPDKRFFIGVMWHPEFLITPNERALWEAFIVQAQKYHKEKIELCSHSATIRLP